VAARRGWSVLYLRPETAITRQTLVATVLFGSVIALFVGFATFLRSLRIEAAYATSERQRAALTETNQQLEHAQSELARSAKLAALGHLAASVTHELGQPISAFRNHLVAADISGEITSPTTASSLNKLVDRMEAITLQFRYFAHGKPDRKLDVMVSDVVRESVALLRGEIDAARIDMQVVQPKDDIVLHGNKIQLEQAMTNLLKNAVHAVTDTSNPTIRVEVKVQNGTVDIRVCDNGAGLDGANLKDLQEPFVSTKPSGVAMGLGLAITTEILRDHGGTLTLAPSDVGAVFAVTLPIKGYET
jgi:two-component system C4-dicarboxylate transport sensor histidine kinase DctB